MFRNKIGTTYPRSVAPDVVKRRDYTNKINGESTTDAPWNRPCVVGSCPTLESFHDRTPLEIVKQIGAATGGEFSDKSDGQADQLEPLHFA